MSVTRTSRLVTNAVLVSALWGVPAMAVTNAAGPALLVAVKFTPGMGVPVATAPIV